MTTFYKFMITNKITDESPVGDFARDMKADLTWPRTCKYIYDKNFLLNYLRRRGACSQALDAFEEAWDEYDKFRAIQVNQGDGLMNLTNDNYFSSEAMKTYWSVSQFKSFQKCEACGLAEVQGKYQREETDALLIGKYVDAFFSGEMPQFLEQNGSKMVKKNGELLAKFEHANDIISRVRQDPLMVAYLLGEKQKIMTAKLFGIPWKIKMDVYDPDGHGEVPARIVDLKCVKDFEDIYDPGYGRRSWIEYWGYDIQGAVYQRVVEENTGERLPFYIAAVTKEKTPDIKLIQIPQHILDAALKLVEAKIDRFDLIKMGIIEPIRCERCEYCRSTKVLEVPEIYEIPEAK